MTPSIREEFDKELGDLKQEQGLLEDKISRLQFELRRNLAKQKLFGDLLALEATGS